MVVKFLLIVLAVTLADVCWTKYFLATADRRAATAGAWSSFIILLGAYTTINYVHNPLFIVAAMIGAFIGTAGTVWWSARTKQ